MIPPSDSTFLPDSQKLNEIKSHARGWSLVVSNSKFFSFFFKNDSIEIVGNLYQAYSRSF